MSIGFQENWNNLCLNNGHFLNYFTYIQNVKKNSHDRQMKVNYTIQRRSRVSEIEAHTSLK